MIELLHPRESTNAPSTRRRPRLLATLVLATLLNVPTSAWVLTYEANVPPEELFDRNALGNLERTLENGWFTQTYPGGGQDFYYYNIGSVPSLVDRFSIEWRATTNYPDWLIDKLQVPTVVAAGGSAGILYHTVMTETAAALYRDSTIPLVLVATTFGQPHIYRVEVYSDEYVWYVDGVMVDSGTPEGQYPDPNAQLVWGSRSNGIENASTAWDYVRFGRIPDDASGDYDSDGGAGLFDYYFVHDCLTKDGPGIFGGPGKNAGPGCRFTDFDSDGDADLLDLAAFQNLFTAELD